MVGMATGLAEAGFTPYVYSISTFASMRPYEFIRNGPVLHGLPVRVVGIGEGVDYGHNGMTHYALEDVALMRAQPGLTVVAPADARQVAPALPAVQAAYRARHTSGSASSPSRCRAWTGEFELGRAQQIGDGRRRRASWRSGRWRQRRCECRRRCSPTAGSRDRGRRRLERQPGADRAISCAALSAVPLVARRVEAHYVNGGLGSLVAEVIAEHGLACRLLRAGVHDDAARVSRAAREYMHEQLGLSPAATRRDACSTPARADDAMLSRRVRPQSREALSRHRLLPRRARGADHARAARQGVQQIGADYEIIFVNDGSPDNAREVLAELAARDPTSS